MYLFYIQNAIFVPEIRRQKFGVQVKVKIKDNALLLHAHVSTTSG